MDAFKAEQDFAAGEYRIYCGGKATAGIAAYVQYLRDHYNIIFCLLSDSTPAYDAYTARMFELLRDQFGCDVFYTALETVGILPGCYPVWPPALEYTLIRMFADFGSCLWDRNGTAVSLEAITGMEQELDDRLYAWVERYSTVADVDDGGKWFITCSPDALHAFNEVGRVLAFEVRRRLPDTTILTYASVLEDACWGEEIRIEPLLGGASGSV
ncbi:hypothetical protein [Pontiella agarivorans]|nr:hypothetical protein [Pontiella agarivorans]